MKKLFLTLLIGAMLLCSCSNAVTDETDAADTTDTTAAGTMPEETEPVETEPEKPIPVVEEDVNADSIKIKTAEGLNEVIYLQLKKPTYMLTDFSKNDYKVSYRPLDEAEFTELDRELYLDEGTYMGCYILGLPEGKYCVKIEKGEGEDYARTTLLDIDVERQDRSGYAHFQREERIGGYNNDGSVKENAVILYVNNANKNTVTLDIDGTTYTGLVAILQAKQYMEEPLIIRVTDQIKTNQFMPAAVKARPTDDSYLPEDYFANTLSTRYGENLIGLPIEMVDAREGKLYIYHTTADGFELQEVRDQTPGTEVNADGVEVYNDSVVTNFLWVEHVKDLTIEGVGKKAEFLQFGFSFTNCDSFEMRNMTMSSFPVTALSFQSFGKYVPYQHDVVNGGYWIHNNTFKAGMNSWPLGVEEYGDETIASCWNQDVTISYNVFEKSYKALLLGTYDKDVCRDTTIHHNFFLAVNQRTPLTRNCNIHSYNNVYGHSCGISVREAGSNYFGEHNWFNGGLAYYDSDPNKIKSWMDVYAEGVEGTEYAVIADSREYVLENNQCSPDGVTDYSTFDTNPDIFYYDAENKCSDVELLIDSSAMTVWEAEDWMRLYAGAGQNTRLELDGETAE